MRRISEGIRRVKDEEEPSEKEGRVFSQKDIEEGERGRARGLRNCGKKREERRLEREKLTERLKGKKGRCLIYLAADAHKRRGFSLALRVSTIVSLPPPCRPG